MVRRRQYCVYICYVCSTIRNYHTYLKIHIWITLNIHKCDTVINVEHLKASGQYCTQAGLKSSNYGIFRMNGAWELKSNIFSKRLPMDCWLWCSIQPLDLVGLLVVDIAVVPIHQDETMSPTPARCGWTTLVNAVHAKYPQSWSDGIIGTHCVLPDFTTLLGSVRSVIYQLEYRGNGTYYFGIKEGRH